MPRVSSPSATSMVPPPPNDHRPWAMSCACARPASARRSQSAVFRRLSLARHFASGRPGTADQRGPHPERPGDHRRVTAERAKQIGITIGTTSHPDIADAHVAPAAAERGHAVLTSDDDDQPRADPRPRLTSPQRVTGGAADDRRARYRGSGSQCGGKRPPRRSSTAIRPQPARRIGTQAEVRVSGSPSFPGELGEVSRPLRSRNSGKDSIAHQFDR